nr:aminopeptidase P family N-terminal domain-containing protein [Petrotoga sp. 9PW.55.5.1]
MVFLGSQRIPKNPVIISYALISEDNAFLFVNKNKINEKVTSHLKENGVEIKEYDEIVEEIENIPSGSKVFLDPSKINRWLYKKIPERCEIIKGTNITTYLKSIKNEVEIKNQKNAYIKDGVALVKFIYWLEKNVGKIRITERYLLQKN